LLSNEYVKGCPNPPVGGPVIHDKIFFFLGYQRTAFRNLVLGSSHLICQTDITFFLSPFSEGAPICVEQSFVVKVKGY
jgi:hypothetical protein